MSTPSLQIHPELPIREKVRHLQEFLGNHYFDEQGLMYAMWFWKGQELRPFRAGDTINCDPGEGRYTTHGYLNYENSPWTSGLFLWSQCLRFSVTGEEQALAFAARAFDSIDRILQLGEARGEKGYVCKPYDGKVSEETSADQYCAVMMGLWAYRAIAPAAARARIDECIPQMADWWRTRNYSIQYFTYKLVGCDQYEFFNLGFIALNMMAYLATGRWEYLKEAQRLSGLMAAIPTPYDKRREQMFDGTLDRSEWLKGFEHDPERYPYLIVDIECRPVTWLVLCSLPFLMEHDLSRTHLFKYVLSRIYKHIQYGLRPDLLSLWVIQVDLERDLWFPMNVPPTPESEARPRFNDHVYSYYSEICYGDETGRIPHVGVLAHRYARDFCPGALTLAKTLLRKLDNRRLHWFIDPDGKQFHPFDAWMADVLSSEVPAFTCLTYWAARAYGIPLEEDHARQS